MKNKTTPNSAKANYNKSDYDKSDYDKSDYDKSDYDKSDYRSADSGTDAGAVLVASRLQILEYLSHSNQPATLQSICEHFDILSQPGNNALSGRLNRMNKNGYLSIDRKQRYSIPEKTELVIGKVVGNVKGFGFVISEQGEDLYLEHHQMRKVLHGDRVLAKTKRSDSRGRKQGIIIEVLKQHEREIVGYFHVQDGIGLVEPNEPRFARTIRIAEEHFNGAKNGDIVLIKILKHPIEHQQTVGAIIEVVGQDSAAGIETEIALRKHEIPYSWPPAVVEQLASMSDLFKEHINTEHTNTEHTNTDNINTAGTRSNRKDIRALPLVTIDGIDAQDFDDAVYCAPLTEPTDEHPAGWRLIVAIADVSHYVKTDSALDHEAYARGNSVYFPNRVVPMLPENLSNGICSLKPNEDRHCLVCDMQITHDGTVQHYQFYPGLMRSQARLTYELVNAIVVEKAPNQRQAWASITPHLDHLYNLSLCLRKKRDSRGAVEFEFPEPYIQFDDKKRISQITTRQRNDAHRLIEECMLAANVCAAGFLQTHEGKNAIYRNHEPPEIDALSKLRKFLSGLGLSLDGGNQPETKHYSKLLASVAERADIFGVVQSVLLRSLSQAVYSTEQIGHFALAFPIYCHFTSPIRRYCDLVVHRQIHRLLSQDAKQGNTQNIARQNITSQNIAPAGITIKQIGEHCSFAERRADDATRDVISWLKAEFMQDKIGQEFDGLISGVKEFGIFVQLNEIFVDGLVHVTGLGDDYYHFDEAHYQLVGERNAWRFRLGDKVRVRVARVDLEQAKIDFDLISHSNSHSNSRTNFNATSVRNKTTKNKRTKNKKQHKKPSTKTHQQKPKKKTGNTVEKKGEKKSRKGRKKSRQKHNSKAR